METKHQKFKRLATKRTNNILKMIRVLGNCSNRGVYEYTQEDLDKIFGEIEKQLKATKASFSIKKTDEFKL